MTSTSSAKERSKSDSRRVHRVRERPPRRLALFAPDFRSDLGFWIETDPKKALRIMRLVENVLRDPFRGLGKPEPLKHLGPDVWSRRITQEHRLVYTVRRDRIVFLQARYHY